VLNRKLTTFNSRTTHRRVVSYYLKKMKRVIIILISLISQVSCTSSGSKSKNETKQEEGEYTLLKFSFYQDEDGNLFEKKYIAIDEIGQERRYFFDSTMFFGEYPNKVALNKIVDIESFKEFEGTPFSYDKNNVYYVQATSDGHKRWIIEKADPKTFSPLEYRWGKDDKNIFWQTEIVEAADLATFQISMTNRDSASDKNSTYIDGQKIE
jgi:hypothetical protein